MGKSLWDPDFDIPTYGETTFLPSEDKDRLMARNEDHLLRDAMKQFGQAFAMGCLVVAKTRERRETEDQKIQENVDLRKEIKHLKSELTRSNGLHQEAERLRAEKTKEVADLAQEAASLAKEKNKLLAEVDKLKGELTRKDVDLAKATHSFKQDAAQSHNSIS